MVLIWQGLSSVGRFFSLERYKVYKWGHGEGIIPGEERGDNG